MNEEIQIYDYYILACMRLPAHLETTSVKIPAYATGTIPTSHNHPYISIAASYSLKFLLQLHM